MLSDDANALIAGHRQLIGRARMRGQRVNDWIRSREAWDGTVDVDMAVRDPMQTTRLNPACDSGDHLHPNDAGYQAMAQAVPLDLCTMG